ncbi:MAG: O-antigen ligase family protein, partial [Candidatus Omnitrophica bacterium]|nr:O-antigen ligase family protein [Candidatus Omnitrophota bacterium]
TNNGFGGWLIIIIPLFLGLLAKNIIKGVALKILLSILITSLLLCLSATFSRGAWIGFIVAIFLTVLYIFKDFTPKVKLTFLAKGVSILLIFLILPQPLKNKIMTIGNIYYKTSASLNSRIKSIFKIGEGSIPVRFKLWKESLRIIGAYPLTGCGLNTYSKVAPEYKIFEGGGVYSHNSYLQKAAETGLLGLFSFFFVIFNFFKIGMRHFKRSKDYLLLGFLCGILAFLVHAFFDTHLYSLQLVVLFWFMLGLAVAVMKLGLNSG